MTSISNRPGRPQRGWLPIELVSQIVEIFFNRLSADQEWQPVRPESIATDPFLSRRSTSELLGLRLVCKTWALAVPPICFRTVWSYDPTIGPLTSPVLLLDVASSVKRLAFKDIWLSRSESEEVLRRQRYHWMYSGDSTPVPQISRHDDPDLVLYSTITTDQVIELIKSIGQNVTELHMKVTGSILITPTLVKAVKSIQGLKTLNIQGGGRHQTHGGHDAQALSDLFAATPNLECLILHGYDLEHSILTSTNISKLKHLAFIDCLWTKNLKAIADLCTLATNSSKSFEFWLGDPDFDHMENAWEMMKIFQSSLKTSEILSYNSIMDDLPLEIVYLEFPRLRILRDMDHSYYDPDEPAGYWPIFRHFRTAN